MPPKFLSHILQSHCWLLTIMCSIIILIGYLDCVTGPETTLAIFYMVPISVTAWFAGRKATTFLALWSAVIWLLADAGGGAVWTSAFTLYWNFAMRAAVLVAYASVLSQWRHLSRTMEETIEKRTAAHRAEIEERQKAEAALHQSQRLECAGRLLSGVAHDFNNVLQVIRSNADLTLMDRNLASGVRSNTELISKAANDGAVLTQQLLLLSRPKEPFTQVLTLNDILARIDRMISCTVGANISFTLSLTASPWQVKADPAQLDRAILNVVLNARDAMSSGGILTVTTTNSTLAKEGESSRPGVPPGEYALVEIRDSGCGMSNEVKKHLFEPFFTTKKDKGTGLGLANCYAIVKAHGGYIWVESKEGVGTTFGLFFPRTNLSTFSILTGLPLNAPIRPA